mmetsp:Transcript_23714/g.66239  ORF Transcript_23714/g.66239 Transcript_23714/m.66239 type:complete len:90 (-) Transcript_23714:1546-1815(-)
MWSIVGCVMLVRVQVREKWHGDQQAKPVSGLTKFGKWGIPTVVFHPRVVALIMSVGDQAAGVNAVDNGTSKANTNHQTNIGYPASTYVC